MREWRVQDTAFYMRKKESACLQTLETQSARSHRNLLQFLGQNGAWVPRRGPCLSFWQLNKGMHHSFKAIKK